MEDLEKEYIRTKKEWLDTINENINFFIYEEKNPFIEASYMNYFNRVLSQINDLNVSNNDLVKITYIDENNVKVELVK